MISRRFAWLLIAVPLALLLLWFALQPSPEETVEESPALELSGQLLYLSRANEAANLYAYDPETGATQALTEGLKISAFDASPNGQSVYFAAANNSFGADIWQLNIADQNLSQLIECGAQRCDSPQANPNGGYLAYTRLEADSGLPQVWLYSFSTADNELVSSAGQISLAPQWSPDGRLSFYNQSLSAYETMTPGSDERQLHPNALGEALSWAPDGASFVAAEGFSSFSDVVRGTTGEASLQTPEPDSLTTFEITLTALLSYRGTATESLLEYAAEQIEDAAPAFAPNGRWLAFTRKYLDEERWTPGRQLWILEIETGAVIPLSSQGNYQMSAIDWRADSSQLAFVRSNRTNFNAPLEIWIMEPNGGNAHLIAVDAFAPQWLP